MKTDTRSVSLHVIHGSLNLLVKFGREPAVSSHTELAGDERIPAGSSVACE
jgi:hypothetical protein